MTSGSLLRLDCDWKDAELPLPRCAAPWDRAGPCGDRKGLGLRDARCGGLFGFPFGEVELPGGAEFG